MHRDNEFWNCDEVEVGFFCSLHVWISTLETCTILFNLLSLTVILPENWWEIPPRVEDSTPFFLGRGGFHNCPKIWRICKSFEALPLGHESTPPKNTFGSDSTLTCHWFLFWKVVTPLFVFKFSVFNNGEPDLPRTWLVNGFWMGRWPWRMATFQQWKRRVTWFCAWLMAGNPQGGRKPKCGFGEVKVGIFQRHFRF